MASIPAAILDSELESIRAGDGAALQELYRQVYLSELDPASRRKAAAKISQAISRKPRTKTQRELTEVYVAASSALAKKAWWKRYFCFGLLIGLERSELRLIAYQQGRIAALQLVAAGYTQGQIVLSASHFPKLGEYFYAGLVEECTILESIPDLDLGPCSADPATIFMEMSK